MSVLKKKIPLHIQILAALLFGAVFGAVFSINHNEVNISYLNISDELQSEKVQNWEKIIFFTADSTYEYGTNEQTRIIDDAKRTEISKMEIYFTDSVKEIHSVISILKIGTIATAIKPIGELFIRLLSFLAIPLVIATLITGVASLGDIKKLGRIGGRTLLLYITTTAIAITIGLLVANVIRPGEKLSTSDKERLSASYQQSKSNSPTSEISIDIVDFFVKIVPKNPFNAIAEGKMLQLIFFAIMFGITLALIDPKKSAQIIEMMSAISDAMIKMVEIFMKIAPFGVFALIAATVADFGYQILFTLVWYILAVTLGLLLQMLIVYTLILKGLGGMKLRRFYAGMRDAMIIAFSTSSSAATLPVTMKNVEELGVKKHISSFVLPLGATINMDGTALYQGVAAVFIAQVYGMDLNLVQQLTIVLTAVLASIGTAPVPGVGIIMLVMILEAVNIPAEGIALILGVDRILDMLRTVANVAGDASVTIAMNNLEEKASMRLINE